MVSTPAARFEIELSCARVPLATSLLHGMKLENAQLLDFIDALPVLDRFVSACKLSQKSDNTQETLLG